MRLTLTTLVRHRRGLHPVVDGIATSVDGEAPGGRYFVPGLLPCGDCPLCRRALVGACVARRQVLPLAAAEASEATPLELPDRFLTGIDDPPGLGALSDEVAALAGVVASALSAMAAVGAAPGDQVLWLGTNATAAAGMELARARGLKIAEPAPPQAMATEEPPGHGRSQQLIFVTTPDPPSLRRAAALAQAGSALVLIVDGPLILPDGLVLPPDSRLLLQGGYHPDLIPEALAALRRGDLNVLQLTEHSTAQRVPAR
jgi:hypothetical protein